MELIRGIQNLSDVHRPCVATIGNFDGVHLGHEIVIQTLLEASKQLALPSTVITFEPLAREFFAPQAALRLQPTTQRIARLHQLGVERVLVIQFDEALAGYSPARFVDEILVEGLGIAYLSVGDDFKFGHQRAGDFDFLQACGKQYGFEVVAHETFLAEGERVSSGRVRNAVQQADFTTAKNLLGRPYTIEGIVQKGQQRGRTIGFPTANLVLDQLRYAVEGVYSVRVQLAAGELYDGVANVGHRPTVDGQENRLEIHLFNFEGDLYGSQLSVEFVQKIRAEQKFASFDALKAQIAVDAQIARKQLETDK